MSKPLEFMIPADAAPMPIMHSEDEESFVVLGKSMVPDVDLSFQDINVDPVQCGPIDEAKKLLAMELSRLDSSPEPIDSETMNNITEELSPEEVQRKVDALVSENVRLRDSIINHNAIMEAQHNRIMAWKDEVQKTHQVHKEKFAEAKSIISKLRAENDVLIRELDKSTEIKEIQQRELFRLKEELKQKETAERVSPVKSSVVAASNEELELSKKRVSELEKMLVDLSRQSQEIKRSLLQSEEVVRQTTADLKQEKETTEKLKADIDKLREEYEKCERTKETQQTELLELKEELNLMKNIERQNSQVGVNQKDLDAAKARIEELEQLLKIVHLAKDKFAKQNEEIKSSFSAQDKFVRQLTSEVEEKNKTIEELNKKMAEVEESNTKIIKHLKEEMKSMRAQLCTYENMQEELDKVRHQLMSSQASITALQQANTILTAQLSAEQEKVKELKKLENLKDDYFALQQQVNIYKSDFEAERVAKESFRIEKERVMKDFLQIQKRNNELNEEIELIRERGFEVVHNTRGTGVADNRNVTVPTSPQGQRYMCPICSFGFTTYQALENHVERCMDLNDTLP